MDDDTLPRARTPVPPPAFAGTERYRLRRPLGKGGMGEVFEADDLELGTVCALKCLSHPEASFLLRFKDEFRALRDVVHPNLVRLGELHESQGQFFFSMELLHGTDLLRYVRPEALSGVGAQSSTPSAVFSSSLPTSVQRTASLSRDEAPRSAELALPAQVTVGGFDEARVRAAFAQLAVGLAALHRAGKVHRDLKPSNVMVEPDGRVVILDFGVVAELTQPREAEDRVIVGTAHFMAPEQALGVRPAPSADWYALGVMLYQALSGRLPHATRSVQAAMMYKSLRDVAPLSLGEHTSARDLAELCVALLARDPDERAGEREVFEVFGLGRESAGLAPGTLVDASARPVVGREEELLVLDRALTRAHHAQGLTVVIDGPSGIGKSCLLRQFSRDLAQREPSALVLHARCHERESLRFKAFDGVVDGIARHLAARTRRGQRLLATHDDLSALCRVFPVLRSVPALAHEPLHTHEADERDPVETRARAFDTLRALVVQLCEHRKVVVGIDDLHWADEGSLALLEALLRPPHTPRLLLVATSRTGTAPLTQRDVGEVQVLALRGLSPEASRELLTSRLAEAGVSDLEHLDTLLAESHGHPMFLEELAHDTTSQRRDPGRSRLDDALRARAARLPMPAQRLLESIAVAGSPTPHRVMMEVSDLSSDHYALAVETLRAERLVRVSGLRRVDAIEPYHDRVREAVHTQVPDERTRMLHDACARSLLQHGGSPEAIALHLELGSAPAQAASYFLTAADQARSALAFERAARLRQRALSLTDAGSEARLSLLERIADDLTLAGLSREAADALRTLGEAPQLSAQARLDFMRRAAELYLSSGHLDAGHEAARTALRTVGRCLPSSRAGAIFAFLWSDLRVGLSRFRVPAAHEREHTGLKQLEADVLWSLSVGLALVDSVEAAALANQALLHALAHGGPEHVARCLCAAAALASTVGRFGRAARMRAAFDAVGDLDSDPSIRLFRQIADLAHVFLCENDWQRTVSTAEDAKKTWTLLGQKRGWEKAQLSQLECWALHQLGDVPALRTRVRDNVREARETGNRFLEVNFRTFFIDMALADDQPEAALADVTDAIALWKPLSSEFNNQDYLVLCSRTRIALYTGQVHDASLDAEWQRFDRCLLTRVLLLSQDALRLRAALSQLRARKARAEGNESEARRALKHARSLNDKLARHPLPLARMEALAVSAGLADLTGEPDVAIAQLRAARSEFHARGARLWSACLGHELGRRVGGDEGRALLEEARSTFAALGIQNPESCLRGVVPGLSAAG